MADNDVIANPEVQSLGRAATRAGQLLRVLEQEGLSAKALQGPIDDPDGRRKLVIAWEEIFNPQPAGSEAGWLTKAQVAQMLGEDFHGPDQVRKLFPGTRLNQKCFRDAVLFDAAEVEALKGTHVLAAVPSTSVMSIHGKVSQVFLSQGNPWFGDPNQRDAFADAKVKPAGWYWHRKEAVPDSWSTRWEYQLNLVQAPDFVPEAALSAFVYAVHKLAAGERLFREKWIRVNSLTAGGFRVVLAGHGDGLDVSSWGDDAYDRLGVASARKSSWKLAT